MHFHFYSTQYEPKMIYIPTPPNGGLLEILLEFLKEGMNLNGNFQRGGGGSNKENPLWDWGGGVWIFCGPVCFLFFYVQEMEIAAP